MLRERTTVIKATEELQKLKTDKEVIEFIRKYLFLEFDHIFSAETEEVIKQSKQRIPGVDMPDIQVYTYYLLKMYLSNSKNLETYYFDNKLICVYLFYSHIITMPELPEIHNQEVIEKRYRVDQMHKEFNCLLDLLSRKDFNLKKHLRILINNDITQYTQEDFNADEIGIIKERLIKFLLHKKLIPFMDEYKQILEY